ncbi:MULTISPECIES: SURF1 family protein [unclassified Bradyrhizobium]|uniref:SURF1 family protein n=1 Tax=unclassified Bradyrhizobium TaxID=2631580 RepID=UPI0024E0D064|nr:MULTISPECIES: SURF1 family protein [unclassified Bradyrhizobium]
MSAPASGAGERGEPGRTRPGALRPAALAIRVAWVASVAILLALGVWQVERRAWKLDLIDRVERRAHAEPVPAPGPAAWPAINRSDDEYRRVTISGRFLNDRETLVQAVTVAGPGYWVVTPLQTADGTMLVNRGFVPAERREPATRTAGNPDGAVTISGLLRISEPGGGFLRHNDPAGNRWYSRDVAAIAVARGLSGVAPFFVDADARPNPGGFPVGGLTVIAFPNNHLVYALTWFTLALMLAGAGLQRLRRPRRDAGASAAQDTEWDHRQQDMRS